MLAITVDVIICLGRFSFRNLMVNLLKAVASTFGELSVSSKRKDAHDLCNLLHIFFQLNDIVVIGEP